VIPYWQERGWTQTGSRYTGAYQIPYAAFQGWIEQHRSGQIDFFLYLPSDEIRRCSHWACFQHRGNDWYLIHMRKEPKDVGSGIMTIERLITEAYEQ
jgi:predicted acyl esterase